MGEETLEPMTQKFRWSWDYYKTLYFNKLDNLDEIDEFLEKYNLLRLNWKKI